MLPVQVIQRMGSITRISWWMIRASMKAKLLKRRRADCGYSDSAPLIVAEKQRSATLGR